MGDDLPFGNASAGDLPFSDEKLNVHIKAIVLAVEAYGFCMKEMLECGDLINSEIRAPIDAVLPKLIDNTQKHVSDHLKDPKYDHLPREEKGKEISRTWPMHIVESLLDDMGVKQDRLPVKNFPEVLGKDRAGAFLQSILPIYDSFENKFLDVCKFYGLSKEDLPAERVIDAVNFVKEDERYKAFDSFYDWFSLALVKFPLALYDYPPDGARLN